MGTNFYARIIPTKSRKDDIKKAIDENNFDEVKKLVNETYGHPELSYDSDEPKIVGGNVHLGKRSCGWKFLWNPNCFRSRVGHIEEVLCKDGSKKYNYIIDDDNKPVKLYELNKLSIKEFIDRNDVEIYDEYGDRQDKEEFWEMAINWGKENGWDSEAYEKHQKEIGEPVYEGIYANDYTIFLEHCGYKLNRSKSDFYSDGLRFSTSTYFS